MFSFSARKKSVDFQRYVRRLIDLTIPNRAGATNVERYENRHNRVIPALLCPWEGNTPIVSRAVVAITKDLADRGVGLILTEPFDATEVVVGFYDREATAEQPWFFLGVTRTSVPIGGGFWLLGIELTEFMNESWHSQLEPLYPLAEKLCPPSSSELRDGLAVLESLVNQAFES